jgi:hypothetical protein
MITEFQDGFITKAKLNELVGGINTNASNIVEIKTKTDNIIVLTGDITKTVGTGGDFATLNSAINWCKRIIPNGYKLALVITDSILTEYLFIEDCNLGFVEIASAHDSTVTIDGTYLTNVITNSVYFVHGKNSIMPKISFNMTLINESAIYNTEAVLVENNSKIIFGGDVSISNFIYGGVRVEDNSDAVFDVINISGSQLGITALYNSRVSCRVSNISSTLRGIQSLWGSNVDAHFCTCSGTTGFYVAEGGFITANNSTGTLSQTANTITANGIIFK